MKNSKYLAPFLLMLVGTHAVAGTPTGAGTLPWETGLTSIVASFTGPVAYAVSVLGIIIGVGILIFGNDLNAFGRTVVFLVLAASVIVTAANTLAVFTGVAATSTTQTLAMLIAFMAITGSITTLQMIFMKYFKKTCVKQTSGELSAA